MLSGAQKEQFEASMQLALQINTSTIECIVKDIQAGRAKDKIMTTLLHALSIYSQLFNGNELVTCNILYIALMYDVAQQAAAQAAIKAPCQCDSCKATTAAKQTTPVAVPDLPQATLAN